MNLRNKFNRFYSEYTRWFSVKRPQDILISAIKLGEEAGEVAEAVIAFTGASTNKIKKLLKKGKTPKDAIKEELGDVIVVCLNIATLCKINHEELFDAAAKKVKRRTDKIMIKTLTETLNDK